MRLEFPDRFGPAGKAWHRTPAVQPDADGNIVMALLEMPGLPLVSSWYVAAMREYRWQRGGVAMPRLEGSPRYEFLVQTLPQNWVDRMRLGSFSRFWQQFDRDIEANGEIERYPVYVQLADVDRDAALLVFNSAVTTLVNGFLLPTRPYFMEWKVVLKQMASQWLAERVSNEAR